MPSFCLILLAHGTWHCSSQKTAFYEQLNARNLLPLESVSVKTSWKQVEMPLETLSITIKKNPLEIMFFKLRKFFVRYSTDLPLFLKRNVIVFSGTFTTGKYHFNWWLIFCRSQNSENYEKIREFCSNESQFIKNQTFKTKCLYKLQRI